MLRIRLALGVSAIFGMLAVPAVASAVPGDRAISDPLPGTFRLDDNTLEPGCFVPGRFAPVEIDSHLVIGSDPVTGEAHVSVDRDAAFSVDQVLVPSPIDGYKIHNTFDTGSINNDADIDPGQTATMLDSPTRFVDTDDIIVCVSHHLDADQNEPYVQEEGGLVSAINRPVVAPKVTALGVSAIEPLNTFRLGFGYDVEQWYTAPVGDPEASGLSSDGLPSFVRIAPRPNDFPYDARRVNDVDESGEAWFGGDVFDGQDMFFSRNGDDTAWIRKGLTDGDLPYSWTLRPSLANPGAERTATLTLANLHAWDAAWQSYYKGEGSLCDGVNNQQGVNVAGIGCVVLAPGSNSPDADESITVIVNPPVTQPLPTPANPAPVVQVITPAAAPAPAASTACQGYRVVRFSFSKKATAGKIRYNGKTVNAKMRDGRLRASAKLFGATASSANAKTRIVKMTKINGSWKRDSSRYKICA